MTGRAEEHEVACGAAGIGVSGGIFLTQVGLVFHDAAGQQPTPFTPDKHLAQQIARNGDGIAIEEVPR